MTKKYRVTIKQYVDIDIYDNSKRKDKDVIKEALKRNAPFSEVCGMYYNLKTKERISILSIKKTAEYKKCLKCGGTGEIETGSCYWGERETDCPKCKGKGEVIKK